MDLKLIKQYFQASLEEQIRLQKQWKQFENSSLNTYSLYFLIATKHEDKLTVQMIEKFMESFNWHGRVPAVDSNKVNANGKFMIHSIGNSKQNSDNSQEEQKKLLRVGVELLAKAWGNKSDININYDQFSLLTRGKHSMPNSTNKNIDFKYKQNLFENLLAQIEGLIKLESLRKAVYHEYKNLTDLFEMLMIENQFGIKSLERLFLNQGERKQQEDLKKICIRAELPMNFDKFLEIFKLAGANRPAKQYKVFYSSARNKKNQDTPDKMFTTPRHSKMRPYPSSTKLTKAQIIQLSQQSKIASQFTLGDQKSYIKATPSTAIQLLSDILVLEQSFNSHKIDLIQKSDLDLELVYERYGKRFESILNERYGVCNFSSFSRFIIPNTYQHKYLAFIRFQQSNQLEQQTQQMIQDLLTKYTEKEYEIKKLWTRVDKQFVHRFFCSPAQDTIKASKLREHFTSREAQVLLDRLDPHRKQCIELSALQ